FRHSLSPPAPYHAPRIVDKPEGRPYTRRMPKQDKTAPQTAHDESTVRLKPILGLRPGQYLTVLYGLGLLLAVYLLLFMPGIKHHGAYLSLRTFPEHATVTIDGVYAGSTPCTVFLRHGQRSVEISHPYYTPVTVTRSVRGRIFATLVVPDRSSASAVLQLSDAEGLATWTLSE